MRSNKRYTNTTFTKRVDHEAGHKSDKHPSEPALCEKCGALYRKGHWTLNEGELKTHRFEKPEVSLTTCPACLQMAQGEPAGFVYIEGSFLGKHVAEIENLLKHEDEDSALVNPLARIMEVKRAENRLVVTTTTENLAQRLGRSLNRAFGGDVRYDFSHENKLARVYWHRE